MEEMTVEEEKREIEREIKELAEEARRNKDFFKLASGAVFVTAGALLVCIGLDSIATIGIGIIFIAIGGILLFRLSKTMCSGKT